MSTEKKIAAIVFGLVALLIIVLCVVDTAHARTVWPRQMTVNGAAVGDTVITLPESQPVSLTDSDGRPVLFYLVITASGGYALPNLVHWEAFADGEGATVQLLNLETGKSRPDSANVRSMGSATNVYLVGTAGK